MVDPWKQVSLTHSFFLDRYEVTVDRLKAWVAAGSPPPCTMATAQPDGTCPLDPTGAYPEMRWHVEWNPSVGHDFSVDCASPWSQNGSTYPVAGGGQFPANCVSWTEAVAFCAWEGQKRLPTQVEWNYEARAGDHRSFVWGNTAPDCTFATFDLGGTFCGFPVPVGTAVMGASAHGAFDLNGSIWEWGWDGTNASQFGVTAVEVPADSTNFTGVDLGTSAGSRPLFGGEWGEQPDNMDLVNGNGHSAGVSWPATDNRTTIGFRCVSTAP